MDLSDPVSLHILYPFRPVELVQTIQQSICIEWYPQHPLLQIFADYRITAFLMGTIGQYFLVGTNNAAMFAPPYLSIIIISQTFAVGIFPDCLPFLFSQFQQDMGSSLIGRPFCRLSSNQVLYSLMKIHCVHL